MKYFLTSMPVIVSYRLDYTLDYSRHELRCSCCVIISNCTARAVDSIPLLLYHQLKIISIKTSQGQDVSFRQAVKPFTDMPRYKANCIEVMLHSQLPPKREITIDIVFAGKLSGYAETGMRYIRDTINEEFTILRPDCRAYPEIGYPSWKRNAKIGLPRFDYEVSVTVPDRLIVANGGELVSRKAGRSNVTYHYRNTKPAWRIDAAIACYAVVRHQSEWIKVFAFQKDFKSAKQIISGFVSAKQAFTKLLGSLKKYHGLTIIEIPDGYGSQADTTCILQERSAFVDRAMIDQLYHEVAHLWDVPCTDTSPARFESEGKATFLQYWMKACTEKKDEALKSGFDHCLEKARKCLLENSAARRIPMTQHGEKMMTGLSDTKGMMFYYLLYRILGERLYGKTMGSFYHRFYLKGASTADFIAYLHALKKPRVDRLVEEWLTGIKANEYIIKNNRLDNIIGKYTA